MEEVNYGRIALIPKGAYSGSVKYAQGDVVTYKGSSYIAKSSPPLAVLPTDTGYWQTAAQGQPVTAVTLTIPVTGWTVAAVGQYHYKNTLAVPGITAQDIPSGTITIETESIAQNCNLAAQCQSGNGTITFYAEKIPSAAMTYQYYVLKGG